MHRVRFERPEQNAESSGSDIDVGSVADEMSPSRPVAPQIYRARLPTAAVMSPVSGLDSKRSSFIDFENRVESPSTLLLNPAVERAAAAARAGLAAQQPSLMTRIYNKCCRKRSHSAMTSQNLKAYELTTHSPKYRRTLTGASLSSLVSPMHSFHMDAVALQRSESRRLDESESLVEDHSARPMAQLFKQKNLEVRYDENVPVIVHVAELIPPRVLRDYSTEQVQSIFDDYAKLLDYEDAVNLVAFEISLK